MGVYTNTMRYTGTSGVDVESMVQALMKAESTRADKLYKQKTRLEWQQQALRTVGNSARTFKNNYLSFSSGSTITNMRSTSSYLSKSISGTFSGGPLSTGASSNILKLGSTSTMTVTSDAQAGNYDVQIKSIAEKQSNVGAQIEGKATATGAYDINSFQAGDYLDLTVNGSKKRITIEQTDLDSIKDGKTYVDAEGNTQTYDLEYVLQNKINDAFGKIGSEEKVKVDTTGGVISFSNNPKIGSTFTITQDSGLANATSSTTSGGLYSGISKDSGKTFGASGVDSYTVNGNTYTVEFGGANANAEAYLKDLNTKLEAENVVASIGSDGNLTFKTLNGDGKESKVESVSRNITAPMQDFEADGTTVSKTYTSSYGLPQTLKGVTASDTFTSNGTDTYTIGSKTIEINFGADNGITNQKQYLEDLNAKLEILAKDTGTVLKATADSAGNISFINEDTSKPVDIEVNRTGTDSQGNPISATFKDDYEPIALSGGVSIASKLKLSPTNLSSTFDTSAVMGLTEDSIESFTFADKNYDIKITKDMTYQQFMDEVSKQTGGKVNLTFNKTSNAFTLASTVAGSNNKISFDESTSALKSKFGISNTATTEASDASLTITGPDGIAQNIVRESNVISYAGINFNLDSSLKSSISASGDTDTDGNKVLKASISVGTDTTNSYDNIKNFISAYNTLIDELNAATTTSRAKSGDYSYYEPLTEEEKTGLSDGEIEKLEAKAKQGILYGNDEVERLTRKMREIATTTVTLEDGTKMSLSSIGITSGDYSSRGKLYITDEEKLKKALETNSEGVAQLFTDSKNGVAEKLYAAVEDAVGNEGYITKNVGFTDSVYVDNNYYSKSIKEKSQQLSDLNDYLIDKENYYYKMFSYMEQSINNANSQMAALGY